MNENACSGTFAVYAPFPGSSKIKADCWKATYVASGLIEDSEQDVGVGDDDDQQWHHVNDNLQRVVQQSIEMIVYT